MPRGFPVVSLLALLPLAAGVALSAWRFRAQEPVSGLACGLGGVLATVLVVLLRDGTFKRRE